MICDGDEMNKCKYSVIVPVYKVEAVLPRCIESILNQTVPDFELILIDDGSPDRSGAICDEYAAKDARIRVIHQKNGGVSRARNAGLDAAQGEYIVFIDSDDYVDATYLQCFDENPADLIIGGYQIEGQELLQRVIRRNEYLYIDDINQTEFISLFENGALNYVWTKCFLASIIKREGIRFDERLQLSEDTLFTVQYASCCHSVSKTPSFGYHYVKYAHETLTGMALSFELIQKLEQANEFIFEELEKSLNGQAASTVAKRISLLYKNFLAECIEQRQNNLHFIYFLFKQKWFRRSLDYVDEIYADEDPKYRMLLKTKSPTLFCLYRAYVRMRNQ